MLVQCSVCFSVKDLGSDSAHRKEIHTLLAANDGNTGSAAQHCCK